MTDVDPTLEMSDGAFHRLLGPESEPGFLADSELPAYWGRKWGAQDEVGRLRTIMMRRPSAGLEAVEKAGESTWMPEIGAYVDPDRRWYWSGREFPDLEKLHSEFDSFVTVLEDNDVEVVMAPDLAPSFTKSVFTRDPLVTIPGGAIIGRLAPRMRRGEEQSITQTVAAQGMPILGTITGTGLVEGGSFIKVRPDLAFFGTSVRCNVEGYRQLRNILEEQGIQLIHSQMPGYQIHLDLCCAMLDDDLALVNSRIAPYDFLDALWKLGIETVDVAPQEDWACNLLTLDRRKLLFPSHLPRTAELLNSKYGVEIIPVTYREINKNGGGLHCSTMELQRDW
ncbi:dimethylarginine dimethylaminohydrolase family protein [Pseudoclavibacter sp. RFBB5]|jgi:N-dimethylarginine dimethylaminohydrolase|uniref:dimethylarginine dimethylaminohydrolase family protein n=1 Tax=Pseudoclavibacter sp. RFBB5 TaxID=2080574 RepID=UPI000CE745EA|nr:arginine deiminase family protein [Pseudoclavibacter sp. RFBB5]PPG28988.1 amidinotransferase [Pseudoclavibacter sp. RFBB5]